MDTIRIKITGLLKKPYQKDIYNGNFDSLPKCWSKFDESYRGKTKVQIVTLVHIDTGIKIYLVDGLPKSVQFNLPKAIYDHNGFQIMDQATLDKCFAKRKKTIESIIEINPVLSGYLFQKPTRLDFSLHLAQRPREWLPVLRHATHDRFRMKGRGKYFEGFEIVKEGKFKIIFYDKVKQLKDGYKFPFTRVEVQLRNEYVPEVLFTPLELSGYGFETLNYLDCYKAFREILLGLSINRVPDESTSQRSILSFLANMELDGCKDGVSILDRYIAERGIKLPRARIIRKEVSRLISARSNVPSLSKLLPLNGPLDLKEQCDMLGLDFESRFPQPRPDYIV